MEGAKVVVTSRKLEKAQAAAEEIKATFGLEVQPFAAFDDESTTEALKVKCSGT